MDILSKQDKENFESNFRKLWLLGMVNCPFVVSVVSFQKHYGLPVKCSDKDYLEKSRNFIDELEDKKVNSGLFIDEAKKIMTKFGFESFWLTSFLIYLITDQVFPPYKKRSKKIPSKGVLEGWKIFNLYTKRKSQKWFLKEIWDLPIKRLENLSEYLEKPALKVILPDGFIHSQSNIAETVWGSIDDEDMSDEDLSIAERKMIQNIKQKLHRFKKLFVPCTKADLKLVR